MRRRPVVATLLIAVAALVKVPAALGLVAVAVLWATRLRGRLTGVRAAGAVAATVAATTALLTVVAGTGYGWIGALDTPISAQNWSLTGLLGRWSAEVLTHDDVGAALAVSLWRWAGVLATLVAAVLVWSYRWRLGPVYGVGIVLVAVVVFGPAVRPWYVVWGLVPLAAVATHRSVRRVLAVCCAGLALVVLPDGYSLNPQRLLLALIGGLVGVAAFVVLGLMIERATWRTAWAATARHTHR